MEFKGGGEGLSDFMLIRDFRELLVIRRRKS